MTFTFRPVLTIVTLLSVAILLWLGTWQVQRLQWKRDLIEKIETRMTKPPISMSKAIKQFNAGQDIDFTPVYVSGGFDVGREAHIFGTYEGQAGFYLFTPMRIDNQRWLYINRGFVPQELKPELPGPSSGQDNRTTITGIVRRYHPSPKIAAWLTPRPNVLQNIWYERNPTLFAEVNDISSFPFWVDMAPDEDDEWPQQSVSVSNLPNRHLQYALTWYALAIVLLGVYAAFSFVPSQNVKGQRK
ncbi:MAG: SURF1 family protein [bacterium]